MWVGRAGGGVRGAAYLLVGQQWVCLQRVQVPIDEGGGSVVFAEQAAVDVVEPVARHQTVPAGGACEALRKGGGVQDQIEAGCVGPSLPLPHTMHSSTPQAGLPRPNRGACLRRVNQNTHAGKKHLVFEKYRSESTPALFTTRAAIQ